MTQNMQQTAVVAIFGSRYVDQDALVTLNQEGVDMKRLSIVDKDFHAEQHTSGSLRTEQFFVLVHGTAEVIAHTCRFGDDRIFAPKDSCPQPRFASCDWAWHGLVAQEL